MNEVAFGSEQELPVFPKNIHSGDYLPCCDIPSRATKQAAISGHGLSLSDRTWLFNGGCMYQDSGCLECCTPECRDLSQIVTYEFAACSLAAAVVKEVDDSDFGFRNHYLLASNSDHKPNWMSNLDSGLIGYHENYRFGRDDYPPLVQLAPFLAVRPLMAGAGFLAPDPYTDRKFYLSYRSLTARSNDSNELTASSTSLLQTKSEHRLQVASGERNISETATKLKFGSTALVVKLLEDGIRVPGLTMPSLDNIASAMNDVSKITLLPEFNQWQIYWDNKKTSAVDILELYLNACGRYQGTDEDTDWTLNMWAKTLDTLRNQPLDATWLDWVKKWHIADSMISKGAKNSDLVQMDRDYHNPEPSRNYLAEVGQDNQLKASQINFAVTHPPVGTRAETRSLLLHKIAGTRREDPSQINYDINWHEISARLESEGFTAEYRISMADPSKNYNDRAKEFLSFF